MRQISLLLIVLLFTGCQATSFKQAEGIDEKISKIKAENLEIENEQISKEYFKELLQEEEIDIHYNLEKMEKRLGTHIESTPPEVIFDFEDEKSAPYFYINLAGECKTDCCSTVNKEELDPLKRLEVIKQTKGGAVLQRLRDPEDGYLEGLYEGLETDLSFEEFYKSNPVLYWENPRDEWIRFKNREIFKNSQC